jgi:hypothetical protein
MNTRKLLTAAIFAGATLAPFAFSTPAEAAGYCREYQKSIYVGGDRESGYGTACLQPDGSWMIVSTRGSVDPFEELRNDNAIIYAQHQPVYYQYGPSYRPVTYYTYVPRPVYRPRPQTTFFLSFGDNDRWDRHHHGKKHWNHHRGWDRHDRWDRDDHRGRGRGRDHD